jgi:ATP-dependent Clp protease protease subunit
VGQPPIQPMQIPQDAYGTFCGQITQVGAERFIQHLTLVFNNRSHIKQAHLLFQSIGGFVGDAVLMYNFMRSANVDLTIYNAGAVQSAGVIVYLGAKKRKASAYAAFMIHRSTLTNQNADAMTLQDATKCITLDDQRTEAILREHLNLTEDQWFSLSRGRTLYFSGEDAVRIGLATEIGEFSPTPGCQIFNIGAM